MLLEIGSCERAELRMAPDSLNPVIECGRPKEHSGVPLPLISTKASDKYTYKIALRDPTELPCHYHFPVEALFLDLCQLQPSRVIVTNATPSGTRIFQMISPDHTSADHFLQAFFI